MEPDKVADILQYAQTLPQNCVVTKTGDNIGLEYPNNQTIVCNFVFDQPDDEIMVFAKFLGTAPYIITELAEQVLELSEDRSDLLQAFGIAFNSLSKECEQYKLIVKSLTDKHATLIKQLEEFGCAPTVGEK